MDESMHSPNSAIAGMDCNLLPKRDRIKTEGSWPNDLNAGSGM